MLACSFASSGRARIAYEVTGSGPDVLLIHAGVNDRRSWHHVLDRLRATHRCITYDARGYGDTTYAPEPGWSPVADACAVLDDAGAGRAIVVACSMGGQTAIDLALARPDRVAGLVLIGSAVRGAPYPEIDGPAARLDARIEAARANGDLETVNELEAWLWLDGPTAPQGRVAGAARRLFLEMNARALRAPDRGEQAELPPAWPRLGEIAVPTLVLVGRLDVEELHVVDARLAELVPGARLVWLDGVAHVPHLEGDEATLEHVATFVAGLG